MVLGRAAPSSRPGKHAFKKVGCQKIARGLRSVNTFIPDTSSDPKQPFRALPGAGRRETGSRAVHANWLPSTTPPLPEVLGYE